MAQYTFSDFVGLLVSAWILILGANTIMMMIMSLFRQLRSPDPKKISVTYQNPL
jgi:hypothetical protein